MNVVTKESFMKILRNGLNKLKIRKYWGLWILLIFEVCFILFLTMYGEKIYLQWNDNLDSNIALSKMFKDNEFWRDRQTPVPFLGGVERSILTSGYNLTSVICCIFDIHTAFWFGYILAVLFSGGGCFLLGNSIKKLTGADVNPNIFCVCGIIYIFLGMWPQSIIGFALIPCWVWLVAEIYRTRKMSYLILFPPIIYNISTPLIGIFLIFYTGVFCVTIMLKEKKIEKILIATLGMMVGSILVIDRRLFGFLLKGSQGLVKGQAQTNGVVYTDSIKQCIINLKDALLLKGSFYHAGLGVLRYVALPLILLFFFLFNFEYKVVKANKHFVIVYDVLLAVLFVNACGYAFDQCYIMRKFIPFMSGFSIKRFLWISPFVMMMCIVMILHYLNNKKFVRTAILIIITISLSVILDPEHSALSSMYNILYTNYAAYVKGEVNNQVWRWNDFYAEELFEEIKSALHYEGEWSVAYGLDPAVLQYNGIRTLDGYYSNYPSEYKEKWEQLILPVLEESDSVEAYWRESGGIRAYIYSTEWDTPGKHSISNIQSADMLINPDVLRELGGEYVFSIVEITNAAELGLDYVESWSDVRGIYKVRVYHVRYNDE